MTPCSIGTITGIFDRVKGYIELFDQWLQEKTDNANVLSIPMEVDEAFLRSAAFLSRYLDKRDCLSILNKSNSTAVNLEKDVLTGPSWIAAPSGRRGERGAGNIRQLHSQHRISQNTQLKHPAKDLQSQLQPSLILVYFYK